MLKDQLTSFDERRNLYIGSNTKAAIDFAVEHWVHSAERAIQRKGKFAVALSGGSTPKAIYPSLATDTRVDWSRVLLFWSDERAVPPTHSESNYNMAMESLGNLPIPPHQIFRMKGESEDLDKSAREYEEAIRHALGRHLFDLVMLGVGEDGHTASLFPKTTALEENSRWVVSQYVPQKKCWRMTLTFPCIDQSAHVAVYALGEAKADIVQKVLEAAICSEWPASHLGTPEHKALWILDAAAARKIDSSTKSR